MSLALLRGNLQEIYATAHCNAVDARLVPNPQGTRIYCSTGGWGNWWDWLLDSRTSKLCLKEAILHTNELFQKYRLEASRAADQYINYLQGAPLSEAFSIKKVRAAIIDWHEATAPFIKLYKKMVNPICQNLLCVSFTPRCPRTPFAYGQEVKLLRKLYTVVAAEGVLQMAIPTDLLTKIASKEPLSNWEEQSLEHLANEIAANSSQLKAVEWHTAIDTIAAYLNVGCTAVSAESAALRIKMALVAKQCNILVQPQSQQLRWRSSLRSGAIVFCDNQPLLLGDSFPEKMRTSDSPHLVFKIQNCANVVLRVPWGRLAALEQELTTAESWGAMPARNLYIDPKGRFVLQERLVVPLNGHRWKSNRLPLRPKDKSIATTLISLLGWYQSQNQMPQEFSTATLMFDAEGLLKSYKPSRAGSFDFNTLLSSILHCTQGHPIAFRYVMKTLKLPDHPYAKFYRAVLENDFQGGTHVIANIAAVRSIDDHRVVAHGQTLVSEVTQLLLQCKGQIQPHTHMRDKHLNALLKEAFLKSYDEAGCAGILPPFLEEAILMLMRKRR